MSEQTSTNKETKLFLGRYEILSEVGHGGMGRVYKVKDVRLDRIVALKVLLKSLTLNEENIQRFMREAKSNAALRHPNIVTLYDFGKVKETVYLTMDFIEGGSLEDFLKREKPSFEFSCKILLKLLDAIGYAHGKNIIHRDIKPSNILLQGENPFITDFGLAKAVHDSINLSQSGAILGTPSYMAPEQAQGMKENPVDQQSDIYSLGATFYQMLTGKLPIEGETVFQIMYKLASEIPPKPCDICPEIPLTLSEICLKALEKDKKSRYQTTEEMAKAIQHYLEGSTPSEKKLLQEKRPFEKTHFRKNLPEQKTTLIDKNRTIPAMEKPSKAKPGKGKERKKTSHNSEIKLSLFLILGAAIVVVLLIFVISINKKNTKPYPIVSENTRPEEPKHPVIEKRPEEPKHPVIEKRPEEPKHPV
ncbi:MAG: protein kinase, partial [Candidatus Brocadiae bacterium]|nr:protein kinase [Candidatus Brocadiia bacterium]